MVVLGWAFVLSFARPHGIVRKPDFFVEAVHVELSNEGCVVIMLEELGDQLPCEFVLVNDDERITLVRPPNEIRVSVFVEETIEL